MVDRAKKIFRLVFSHENAWLGSILVGLVVVLAVATKGLTITRGNISNVLLHSANRGIAAIAQMFVILSGGVDVSLGGIALLSAIVGSSVVTREPSLNIVGVPLPLAIGIVIMLAIGAGVGAVNGLFASHIRVPPLIGTLAMWQITKGFAFLICRGRTVFNLPRGLDFFGQSYIGSVPVPVIIFAGIWVVGYFVLYHTVFGRSVYACGGNLVSAGLCGINTKKIQFSVYVISGFLAALAGVIAVSRTMSASMNTALGLELDSIAAVCIGGISLMGGRGTPFGVILGVIILGVINNAMNVMAVNPAFVDITKGGLIMAAVAIDVWRRRH